MSSIPAGWHPDPTGRHEQRYWDGAAWTEHVFTAGNQLVDQLPPISPQSAETALATVAQPAATAAVARSASAEPAPAKLSRRQVKRQGRDEFETTAIAAAYGDSDALVALPGVVERARNFYRGKKYEEKAWEVMTVAARDILADDMVTIDEEQHLVALAAAIGVPFEDIAKRDFALFEELIIARINDGRPPVIDDAPIILKPGEIVYSAPHVALMKEVAVREMRGGSTGVSIRVAKGVTYRVGQMRARSVVVGTELQVQDTGHLVVTNQRAVFVGQKRTLEFRYDKLIGMEQFKDGLRLNVSNRQLASLFRFAGGTSPSITAALISHAG